LRGQLELGRISNLVPCSQVFAANQPFLWGESPLKYCWVDVGLNTVPFTD
jgi:hypothetical protein